MEDKIHSFRDLEVWRLGHQLVLEVYRCTADFPRSELYRLTDQLCRAALSVPTNIAEGKGRATLNDYIHFLIIARGSVEETKSLLIIAHDLKILLKSDYDKISEDYEKLGRMLNKMIQTLKTKKSS